MGFCVVGGSGLWLSGQEYRKDFLKQHSSVMLGAERSTFWGYVDMRGYDLTEQLRTTDKGQSSDFWDGHGVKNIVM